MFDLSNEFLQPLTGTIRYYRADLDHPVAGTWSIQIPLAPFSADDEYEPTTFRPGLGGPTLIETEISLDFIKLPATHLMALNQQTFDFATDFEEGFIDGSIYLLATHNRVHVTRIDFGLGGTDQITASLHAAFDFEHARTGIRTRTAELDAMLLFQLVDRLPAPQPPTNPENRHLQLGRIDNGPQD
ncbi:hypothetical protein OG317_01120 [Streptomyces sp. NBC_01167]|uniref:hypothetical protein n=1 Tax=Streptomyces sp. NBC_01167 TaxID=2903756 RepID=UPI003865953C|nr:hypothetical protein OG317_01120 [Streptomyces sp. NBC_01167]